MYERKACCVGGGEDTSSRQEPRVQPSVARFSAKSSCEFSFAQRYAALFIIVQPWIGKLDLFPGSFCQTVTGCLPKKSPNRDNAMRGSTARAIMLLLAATESAEGESGWGKQKLGTWGNDGAIPALNYTPSPAEFWGDYVDGWQPVHLQVAPCCNCFYPSQEPRLFGEAVACSRSSGQGPLTLPRLDCRFLSAPLAPTWLTVVWCVAFTALG